ncbi:MAG: serine/threonine protein kinase [Sandaracinaceae bacterium]|nr:serine/threonine protein kinase [Sandaracinaceae bacterium]
MSAAPAVTPDEVRRLAPGTRVGGRFVLEGLVGQGGMGSVYAARDERIDRRVALKILHLDSARASDRFRAEAAAASRISSRFVSAIHDYGHDEAVDCEYLVMELLDGQPLDAILAAEGPLSASQAAAIGADIAEALAAAHAAEVVHRDLKPGNVLVLAEGGVKVIDFGIARVLALDGRSDRVDETSPDVILGTPAYISPEAVEGTHVGPGADLYALGVILFEMVAGRLPFYDPVASALCTMHLRDAPPTIAEVQPDAILPEAFERLVAALLEKDPGHRPQAAEEVAGILRGIGGDTSALRLGRHASPTGARTSRVTRADAPRPSRRLPLLVAIGIAALTIPFLGVVLAILARTAPEPPAPPPPEPPVASTEPEPELTPAPTPPPPEAASTTVEIPVAVAPPSATLTLDGVEVQPPLELPADATEHELVVRAPGYRPETRALRGDRDRSVTIALRRAPTPRRSGLPAKLREW